MQAQAQARTEERVTGLVDDVTEIKADVKQMSGVALDRADLYRLAGVFLTATGAIIAAILTH